MVAVCGVGFLWWSVEGAFSCLGHVFAKCLAAACVKIEVAIAAGCPLNLIFLIAHTSHKATAFPGREVIRTIVQNYRFLATAHEQTTFFSG